MPFSRQRVPALSGALNFRDMGGYPAAGGRSVRWNRLYRSGTTHEMTGEDLERIAASGIRYVCDLRSNGERRHFPNRLNEVADIEYWFRDHERLPGDLSRMIRAPNASAQQTRQLMLSVYRDLPYDFRDAYRELFERLADNRLPLVFNCTAGKDRTGVAAALVLTALDVPRRIVEEDYMLTAQFYEQSCELMLRSSDSSLFSQVDRSIWEPLMLTDPAYLEAMFGQLEAAHGSVAGYLRDELGIDEQMLGRLRGNLLED